MNIYCVLPLNSFGFGGRIKKNSGEKEIFMAVKAIVFDKDGTLVDFDKLWIPAAVATASRVFSHFGAGLDMLDEYLFSIGVRDGFVDIRGALPRGDYRAVTENMKNCLVSSGIECDYATLYPLCVSVYSGEAKQEENIYPICDGLRESLIRLKERGLTLAVITGDALDGALMCFDKLGITDLFDEIFAYDGIHSPKPDSYFMDVFCEKHGFLPSEVVMVGDTETDMLFAKNAGVYPLGVGKTEENREHLLSVGASAAVVDISFIPDWLCEAQD